MNVLFININLVVLCDTSTRRIWKKNILTAIHSSLKDSRSPELGLTNYSNNNNSILCPLLFAISRWPVFRGLGRPSTFIVIAVAVITRKYPNHGTLWNGNVLRLEGTFGAPPPPLGRFKCFCCDH